MRLLGYDSTLDNIMGITLANFLGNTSGNILDNTSSNTSGLTLSIISLLHVAKGLFSDPV